MTMVKTPIIHGEINGFCDPRFERVATEFERNFRERGEVGASVSVTFEGKSVVDLWGGMARPSSNEPWTQETLSIVWSCTKGATALCAHILASRGLLDFDAPVAHYWPEFAQAGKESIPVKMLLNHQAGLVAIRETLPQGAYYDWDVVVNALAKQEPWWKPGTMHGYHMQTFGWLVGEVVRRVSGKSLGTFFREEVAQPLGLDFWIGLPKALENRVAPILSADPLRPNDPISSIYVAMADMASMQGLSVFNSGGYMLPGPDGELGYNSQAAHAAEIGAAGGVTNARGLAGMYAPLANGGSLNGIHLVTQDDIARMTAVSSASALDATLLAPTRFGLGYAKTWDNRHEPSCTKDDSIILSESAFGHPGSGGFLGFADPEAKMSFGYTLNKMGNGLGLNERGQSLVDATYLSLGYNSNVSGSWLKTS